MRIAGIGAGLLVASCGGARATGDSVVELPASASDAGRRAAPAASAGVPVRRDPGDFTVWDARTRSALAGATVTVERVPGEPRTEACGRDQLDDGPRPGGDSVSVVTDAAGHAVFSAEQLRAMDQLEPSCPRGAPCLPLPRTHIVVHAAKQGYLPLLVGGLDAHDLRLVPAMASVRSRDDAVAAMRRVPHVGAFVAAMPYDPLEACLTREGTWLVAAPIGSAPSHSSAGYSTWYEARPTYLPRVIVEIDPVTGHVGVQTCPGQGAPLRMVGSDATTITMEDLVTGYAYQCPAAACAASLTPGTKVEVISYGPTPASCEQVGAGPVAFDTRRANDKAYSCFFRGCSRAR